MTVNPSGWRPSAPANEQGEPQTVTGNKALMLEEPLIFEIGSIEQTGVDFPEFKANASRLGNLERNRPIGLAGLSEPEGVRHYTRLSRQNYAIDLGLFPLGSCTMKHNPRLNEKLARLPGFADIHPLQPQETVQGAIELINQLAFWLLDLTGMHGVAMSPKASFAACSASAPRWKRAATCARSSSFPKARTGRIPRRRRSPAIAWRTSPRTRQVGSIWRR